jgi:hypothetical protein
MFLWMQVCPDFLGMIKGTKFSYDYKLEQHLPRTKLLGF